MRGLLALAIVILVQGCSTFTHPMERPVIEEKLNKSLISDAAVGTLSLTPERRVVLVNFKSNRFCAEAPTEVGADLQRILKATAEADVPNEVKAKIGAIAALSTSSAVLNKRTQGMQLFLANSYFVCQMYMNGAINEKQLLEYQMAAFNSSATLIEKELPYIYKEEQALSKGQTKFSPLDTNKLIQDILKENDATDGADAAGP